MRDLSPEAFERALDIEIERRRIATESDARYQGAKFEQILASQGVPLEVLRRDPAVVASGLAHVRAEIHAR